jgi:hypothetical protein
VVVLDMHSAAPNEPGHGGEGRFVRKPEQADEHVARTSLCHRGVVIAGQERDRRATGEVPPQRSNQLGLAREQSRHGCVGLLLTRVRSEFKKVAVNHQLVVRILSQEPRQIAGRTAV